jgi:exosortase/archaeosortase family protein
MLLAAVFAYPTSLRRRLAGAAFCLPFTFGVNLLRLDSMAWLGVHLRGVFDVVHELGWEAGVILIGAAGFALWVRVVESLDDVGARGVRVRGLLVSCGTFLVLFAGGMTLALRLGADRALGRAFIAATTPLGRALWGSAYPTPDLAVLAKPILFLTALVGYAALFLATPGVPLRRRANAALWGALLPGLVAGCVVTLTVGGARLGEIGRHPLSTASLLLAHLGLPMLAWILWSARLRREREAEALGGRAPSLPQVTKGGTREPRG